MKKLIALLAVILAIIIFAKTSLAQETKVNYAGGVVVDSDLDGLTDQGEEQIFGTDKNNPDTDGDGIMDGTEIIKNIDPLSPDEPAIFTEEINWETPWVWYVARASGIITFIFLWITIFLGLSIRNTLLKKVIEPIYSFDVHCFMAATAVFWALIHGTSLLFDEFLGFGIKDIAIPFFSKTTFVNTNYLALGIMAFYAMAVMAMTSYLRKHLNHRLWRILHFLNPAAFIFVVIHGYFNGTDTKNIYIGGAFLFFSFVLVLIYLHSLIIFTINKIKSRKSASSEQYDNRN